MKLKKKFKVNLSYPNQSTGGITLSMDKQAQIDHPAFWGQLLMVGIPGPRVDGVARELVRDLR